MDTPKMKILLVSHKNPPSIGGMQKHFYELKNGLIRSGTFKVDSIIKGDEESTLSFFLKVRSRVRIYLKDNADTEAVYINDGLLACILGDLAKKSKAKFFVTVHGLDILFPNKMYQSLLLRQLNLFHRIIPVSNFTGDILKRKGIPDDKIQVILNGVDGTSGSQLNLDQVDFFAKKYEFLRGKEVLLSLGRGVKRKGFSWFARNVMPMLNDDVIYIMIGELDGKNNKLWYQRFLPEKYVNEYRLMTGYPTDSSDILNTIDNRRIFHLGKLPTDEVKFLLDTCNLFIVPNIKVEGDAEGFGLVALEGVMAGKLVIASDIQGLKSAIMPHRNGLLVEPSNKFHWASTIEACLAKADVYDHFLSGAVNYTRNNYTWDKMAAHYSDLFLLS
jgi:phosphatidylinositol alpha-1,6-mannosyltransferase